MKRKNILLVFTDQQRYDTIAALGNNIIKTPVLDSLVKRGTAFNNGYTPCPVCVPARYSLHTGQMPHQSDCAVNERAAYKKSFMEILSENSYQTHGVGKCTSRLEERISNIFGDLRQELSVRKPEQRMITRNFLKTMGLGMLRTLKV